MHKRGGKYRPKMILKFNVQTLTLQTKFTITPELTQNPSRYTQSSERIQKTAEVSKHTLTIQTAKTSQSVQLAKLPNHKSPVQRQEGGGG